MFKKVFAVLLLVALGLSVAGCGQTAKTTEETTPTGQEAAGLEAKPAAEAESEAKEVEPAAAEAGSEMKEAAPAEAGSEAKESGSESSDTS